MSKSSQWSGQNLELGTSRLHVQHFNSLASRFFYPSSPGGAGGGGGDAQHTFQRALTGKCKMTAVDVRVL